MKKDLLFNRLNSPTLAGGTFFDYDIVYSTSFSIIKDTTISRLREISSSFSNTFPSTVLNEKKTISGITDFDIADNEFPNFEALYFEHSIRNLLKNQIESYGFTLENPEEIISFIENNSEVLIVLKETQSEVSKYFTESDLVLSSVRDLEEDYEGLIIKILNNLPSEVAFLKEGELFENWFKKYFNKFNGKVTIREYPSTGHIDSKALAWEKIEKLRELSFKLSSSIYLNSKEDQSQLIKKQITTAGLPDTLLNASSYPNWRLKEKKHEPQLENMLFCFNAD